MVGGSPAAALNGCSARLRRTEQQDFQQQLRFQAREDESFDRDARDNSERSPLG